MYKPQYGKKETTRNDPSFLQCLFRSLLPLLLILNAGARAIMVVVELVKGPEVAAEAERPGFRVSMQVAVRHFLVAPSGLKPSDVKIFLVGDPAST